MQVANTKQARAIIKSVAGKGNRTWTDLCKSDASMRHVAVQIDYAADKHEQVRKAIQDLFTLAGFSNKVKVMTSKEQSGAISKAFRTGGYTYVRVKALLA